MYANGAISKTTTNNHQVDLNRLIKMFGEKLDEEIIESVLINTNAQQAPSILYELCGTVDPVWKTKTTSKENNKLTSSGEHCQESKRNKIEKNSNKSFKERTVERAIHLYQSGYKLFVLLRGLPGSGKSYLARKIVEDCTQNKQYSTHVFSTDDYFIKHGVYNYNPRKIPEAHQWNQQRVYQALKKNINPIIIDNTNTCMWEMRSYSMFAVEYGYLIEVLEPYTSWCFNVSELSFRNEHNVSKDKLNDMLDRYEKNITTDKLLCTYNLKNKYNPIKNECANQNVVFIRSLSNDATGTQVVASSSTDIVNNTSNEEMPCDSTFSKQNEVTDDLVDLSTVNSSKSYPDLKLEAWGINKDVLYSWDIVTPIENANKHLKMMESEVVDDQLPMEIKHVCTSTSAEDFLMLQSHQDNVKYIMSKSRDINEHIPSLEPKLMKRSMLDKSSMTEDECTNTISELEDLKNLCEVFPTIPRKCLNDIYIKCDRNLTWAVELLAENDNLVLIPNTEKEEENCKEDLVVNNDIPETTYNYGDVIAEDIEKPGPSNLFKIISNEGKDLINHLKERVTINANHYSKNLIKLKKQRGEITDDLITFDDNPDMNSLSNMSKCSLIQCPIEKEPEMPKIDSYKTVSGTVLAMDSDVDISDYSDSEEISTSSNEDQFFEINLGTETIAQLEAKFNDIDISYPKDFQPVIQIPVTLARQLHALYIESCFQQLEAQNQVLQTILREDEELAIKLHMEEMRMAEQAQTPDLKEIMDEQAALNYYHREVNQLRKCTPDDLATLLTKQKLKKTFPSVQEDILMEVYQAHNRNYSETVQSLVNSVNNYVNSDDNFMDPPISPTILQDMKLAQEKTPKNVLDTENSHTAEYYRSLAAKHLKTRQELFEKASRYYQQGMFPVAGFYSNLATEQTKLYDQANTLAASTLLISNQNSCDTLDLHNLYVKEALIALDIFLDANILQLQKSNKSASCLHVITGRGNNSKNGIPKVRPAVMARLKKRKIRYSVVNPGLLKIKIYNK